MHFIHVIFILLILFSIHIFKLVFLLYFHGEYILNNIIQYFFYSTGLCVADQVCRYEVLSLPGRILVCHDFFMSFIKNPSREFSRFSLFSRVFPLQAVHHTIQPLCSGCSPEVFCILRAHLLQRIPVPILVQRDSTRFLKMVLVL